MFGWHRKIQEKQMKTKCFFLKDFIHKKLNNNINNYIITLTFIIHSFINITFIIHSFINIRLTLIKIH